MSRQNRAISEFDPPVQFWNDCWPTWCYYSHTLLKKKHRNCIKLYIFWNPYNKTNNLIPFFREIGAWFNFWPTWHFQGQWQPSWKYHNMWHIRKLLLMLCFHSLSNRRLLTNTAQLCHFLVLNCPDRNDLHLYLC